MFPTTFDTETELSAVNSILGSIGQAPVQQLEFDNPEISFIYNILKECDLDIQNEGWIFNREQDYTLLPDSNGWIQIPENVLRMDVTDGQVWRTTDVVKRNGRLYDKLSHSDKFEGPINLDLVWRFTFEDLPSVFKRYITMKAAGRAATQLVGNKELVSLLATQEAYARAACLEYECNQGDYTFFGTPSGGAYHSFQPYQALRR
jgi:hypothetical protein